MAGDVKLIENPIPGLQPFSLRSVQAASVSPATATLGSRHGALKTRRPWLAALARRRSGVDLEQRMKQFPAPTGTQTLALTRGGEYP